MRPLDRRYVPQRVYYGSACSFCFAVTPMLQKCSRCKRVRYCNEGCQKADFPEHKAFCKNLSIARSKSCSVSLLEFLSPSGEATIELLEKAALVECNKTLSILLPLPTYSSNRARADPDKHHTKMLVLLESRCAVCLRSEHNMRTALPVANDKTGVGPLYQSLIPCLTCLDTFACSSAHWAICEHEHKKKVIDEDTGLTQCEMNVHAAEDDELFALLGNRQLWTPDRRRTTYVPLPTGDTGGSARTKWFADPADMGTLGMPAPVFQDSQIMKRRCTDGLYMPLTIMYGVGLFDDLASAHDVSTGSSSAGIHSTTVFPWSFVHQFAFCPPCSTHNKIITDYVT